MFFFLMEPLSFHESSLSLIVNKGYSQQVGDDTKGPDVRSQRQGLKVDGLWCQELWCTLQGAFSTPRHLAGQPEVDEFDAPGGLQTGQHHVLRLQGHHVRSRSFQGHGAHLEVKVRDALAVHVVQTAEYLLHHISRFHLP